MTLYSVGDKVEYMTAGIQTLDRGRIPGEVKIGVIEEALLSLEQKPCYWIENEKQLIFHYQILRHFPNMIARIKTKSRLILFDKFTNVCYNILAKRCASVFLMDGIIPSVRLTPKI